MRAIIVGLAVVVLGVSAMIFSGPRAVATDAEVTTGAGAATGRDEANWTKMQAFLEANKKKPGIIVQPSGIQWRYLKKGGVGDKPLPNATVTVRYKGTFIDGKVFDETQPDQPAAIFGLKAVIKGWQEAIQLMQRGDKIEVVIPSHLAYGPNGRDGIPGDQVLVFEVELLDFL